MSMIGLVQLINLWQIDYFFVNEMAGCTKMLFHPPPPTPREKWHLPKFLPRGCLVEWGEGDTWDFQELQFKKELLL